MNEAELQNLQVGDILYMEGSTIPCTVTQNTPTVVVAATAVVDHTNFEKWSKAKSILPEEPEPVYQLNVQVVQVMPDGTQEEVDLRPINEDFNGKDSALAYADKLIQQTDP